MVISGDPAHSPSSAVNGRAENNSPDPQGRPRLMCATLAAAILTFVMTGTAVAQERIYITSDWGWKLPKASVFVGIPFRDWQLMDGKA